MWRALQLAKNGEGRVSPNPLVGAVIVYNGRIIGEGFHAFFGGPHAEVNAIASVKDEDKKFLKEATIYVTLEPCAHHGKTPPCANLIINTGIPNVVIGSLDPNPLVAGKGVKILENAGIKVKSGVLLNECQEINKRFMMAHNSWKPWIILKWAQSSDGFIAKINNDGNSIPFKFSSSLSSVWMHRERAAVDAILVGKNTEKIDQPRLDVRYWSGNNPIKLVADSYINPMEFVAELRKNGVTSLMVEGGKKLLDSFIRDGLYDEIRVETSPSIICRGLPAPIIPSDVKLAEYRRCRDNLFQVYRR